MTIENLYPVAGQECWQDCEAYVLVVSKLRSHIAAAKDLASAMSALDPAKWPTHLGCEIAAIKALADEAEGELAEILASCRLERGLIH